jgi:hypothetical protein
MLAPMAARLPLPFVCLIGVLLALAGCSRPPPFAQLSGVLLAPQLDEVSGMAASRTFADTLANI